MCGKINFHIIAKSRCPSGYWKANRNRIVNVAKVKGQSSGRWPKTPKTPSGRVSLDLKLVYCLDCAMWSGRHLPPFASINGQNFQRTLAVLVTSSSAIVVEANDTPATLYVWCLLSLWQLWASGKDTPARTSLCWRCENKGYQSALIV